MTKMADVEGEWAGTYRLWFEPGDPISESTTRLTAGADGDSTVLQYSWRFGDDEHEGSYRLASDGKVVLRDSFHTGGTAMECSPGEGDGVIGFYEAEGQRWGWRTNINASQDDLVITAWNVDPGGEESLATEARYTKSQ